VGKGREEVWEYVFSQRICTSGGIYTGKGKVRDSGGEGWRKWNEFEGKKKKERKKKTKRKVVRKGLKDG
jgi:hypothetical protein